MEELFDYIRSLDEIRIHLRYLPNACVVLPERDEIIERLQFLLKQAEVEYESLLENWSGLDE